MSYFTLGCLHYERGSKNGKTSHTDPTAMTWTSLDTTRRWYGRVLTKSAVHWENAREVVLEISHSTTTCAITVRCKSSRLCKSVLWEFISAIYGIDSSSLYSSNFKWFFFTSLSGNRIEMLGTPYKRGKPCSSCSQSCHSKKIRFVNLINFFLGIELDLLNIFPLGNF